MTDKTVWALLYDEDAAREAQDVVAASFGADLNHEVLLDGLMRLFDSIVKSPDPEVRAKRFVDISAALVALAGMSLEALATIVEESRLKVELDTDDDVEADPEAVRTSALQLLENIGNLVRERGTGTG